MPPVERERGDSLVEILVALAVLSIGITALVGALGVNASSTTTNRSAAQLEATLLSAAEHVKSTPFLALCTGDLDWQPPLPDADVPRHPAITVRYRNAHRFGDDSVACDPDTNSAVGDELAEVRVEVTGDGFVARTIDVVMRRELT